ncbi:MAG: DNA-processing protein DprA [Niabella sp.]
MDGDLLYRIALTMIPQIGCVQANNLLKYFGAKEIFSTKKSALMKIEGLGEVRANSIVGFKDFKDAEKEISFIEKYKIRPLFITDEDYPQRLTHCYDAPTLLYYKGSANLNSEKIVAVIGTREHTEYGKTVTEKLVEDLTASGALVVSGLAYGIDSLAHRAALKNRLDTIGVLAHGLDKIYPSAHTSLAKEMVLHGGLLTEFRANTRPDKHNFPSRNRIVAGMSDATIVIETGIKGGSMITAELADGYNRDVFALPGRITDKKSGGCNYLIKSNKAMLLTDAAQLLEVMGWETKGRPTKKKQRELFINLLPEEKMIFDLLQTKEQMAIDEINLLSGLSSSAIAAAMLSLELQQIVQALPGKMYKLL